MRAIFVLGMAISLSASAAVNPCETKESWRQKVCDFAKKNLVHFAWGYEHGIRDYQLSMQIAKEEGINVDEEVLFAAGMLHDMGGFPPYETEGVDHALRSTQVVSTILEPAGFPMNKLEEVKKAILTHSYYEAKTPETPEAILLHDADTLDFMGAVGVARILSIAGKEKGIDDPKSSMKILTSFSKTLFSRLYGGAYTKKLGEARAQELDAFVKGIDSQTFGLGLPLH